MPSRRAASCALSRLREAIALTSQYVPCCIAGMTFATPMLAVLKMPQRTFPITCLLPDKILQYPYSIPQEAGTRGTDLLLAAQRTGESKHPGYVLSPVELYERVS